MVEGISLLPQLFFSPYWFDCFKILRCKNQDYERKILGEMVRERDANHLDIGFGRLVNNSETTWVMSLDRRFAPAVKSIFLKHTFCMPSIEVFADQAKPEKGSRVQAHLAHGLFPHDIGIFVREKGILKLEEAVKRDTFLPAQLLGLKDRRKATPGTFTDLVVFDYENIKMKEDFLNPAQPPEGIEYVSVNG